MSRPVARILLERDAVILRPEEPFTFASGILSPIYCDNRVLLSFPLERRKILESMVALARTFRPEQIAGVATAGIAWGAWLAQELKLPFSYVRSSAKEHGRKNRIEGKVDPKRATLLVEDLISTGGSVISAIEALKEERVNVAGAISIFSYGFSDARDAFAKLGCPYDSAVRLDELLTVALEMGKIAPEQASLVEAWQKSPRTWSARNPA